MHEVCRYSHYFTSFSWAWCLRLAAFSLPDVVGLLSATVYIDVIRCKMVNTWTWSGLCRQSFMHINDVDGTNISTDILSFINLKYAPFQRMDLSSPPDVHHWCSHMFPWRQIDGGDTELSRGAECTSRTAVVSCRTISASYKVLMTNKLVRNHYKVAVLFVC
jgi:hypothetical protein